MRKLVITLCDGEYRVPGPDGREATAYYTDDKGDALVTCADMHGAARVVVRSVDQHPEGR